jgi:putative tryptophan/tyrosine transport system substrate-binding protein
MRRREFLAGLVLTIMVPGAQSRQTGNVYRVAILGPAEEPRFSQMASGLRRGLGEHGHESGLEIIEEKVARGDRAGARAAVERLVSRQTTALFVIGSELARIAREVSPELQIVFVTPGDPVAAGLVASLARPGGNTTAMTFEFPELSAKRLEFLKTLSPRVQRVLVLYDPRDASPRQGVAYAREAALQLGLTLIEREVRDRNDLERGVAALAETDAFLAVPGGFPSAHLGEIVRAANAKRIITFLHSRTDQTAEALASYGASEAEIARQATRLVDKILRGASAGDLPVERPTKLEFVINLKTAKALGIAIPPSLLARADEVIE